MAYIGFQRAPDADYEVGGRRYGVYARDWRRQGRRGVARPDGGARARRRGTGAGRAARRGGAAGPVPGGVRRRRRRALRDLHSTSRAGREPARARARGPGSAAATARRRRRCASSSSRRSTSCAPIRAPRSSSRALDRTYLPAGADPGGGGRRARAALQHVSRPSDARRRARGRGGSGSASSTITRQANQTRQWFAWRLVTARRKLQRDPHDQEVARMRRIGEHAVVIGASMAGLLAARALADAYERVTVLDRDRLPTGLEGAQGGAAGAPCARAASARPCMPRRAAAGRDRRAGGGRGAHCEALAGDALRDRRSPARPRGTGTHSIMAGRPFIEGHVRRRVRALAGRRADRPLRRPRAHGAARTASASPACGSCGRADGSAEETLAADSSSAAGGRGARVSGLARRARLRAAAREERAADRRHYASRHLRLPADAPTATSWC